MFTICSSIIVSYKASRVDTIEINFSYWWGAKIVVPHSFLLARCGSNGSSDDSLSSDFSSILDTAIIPFVQMKVLRSLKCEPLIKNTVVYRHYKNGIENHDAGFVGSGASKDVLLLIFYIHRSVTQLVRVSV